MGNTASARGLRVAGPLLGCHWYAVAATYGTAMYIGDPVVQTGSGNQVVCATAGSTNAFVGAVIGVFDTNKVPGIQASTGERVNYKPASTGAYVLVADEPRQVFIAQTDTGSYTVADCGANCSMSSALATAAASQVGGQSGWTISAGTASTAGTTEQLRLIREVERADNTGSVQYCDWYVFINYHQRNAASVGVGI